MKFAQLDDILAAWARRHGLHVSSEYKEREVRTANIVDDAGCEYQLWIELMPPKEMKVVAWDYGERRASLVCEYRTLLDTLDASYRTVERWIHSAGHTRTPAL